MRQKTPTDYNDYVDEELKDDSPKLSKKSSAQDDSPATSKDFEASPIFKFEDDYEVDDVDMSLSTTQ